MTELELDEILTIRWPRVVRRVMGDTEADNFAKGFARSIARHGKNPRWQPTPKQRRIMRQMLNQYERLDDTEPVLIEEG